MENRLNKIESALSSKESNQFEIMAGMSVSLLKLTGTMLADLYQSAAHSEKSMVFSPFSIAIAMTMLAEAAEEEVTEFMFAKLGLPDPAHRTAFSDLLHATGQSSSFGIGNAVFADKTVKLFDEYRSHLQQLDTQIFQVDVLAKSVGTVNDWIASKTQGMIKNMLSQSSLALCHVVLVNAIAFKQTWKATFNPQNTIEKPFYVTSDETRPFQMMRLMKQSLELADTSRYKAVKIPYAPPQDDPDLQKSMIAYLPAPQVSIEELLQLFQNNQQPANVAFKSTKFDVFGFPKFDLLSAFSAKDVLVKLGYIKVNNFPRMCPGSNQVDDVLHKSYIQVDEEGTTAAAATAVLMTRKRKIAENILLFDRPFVFTIVKHNPDIVLFAGIFSGP